MLYTLRLTLLLAFLLPLAACGQEDAEVPYSYDPDDLVTTESGLQYVIIKKGDGNIPQKGAKITAHYHGLLQDGTVFDSSVERGQPFSFALGQGQVIKGWDEAFALMPVGSKAVLLIPPDLAYGAQARGKIPANATLEFHVELVEADEPFQPYAYNKKKLKEDASGIQYAVVEKGDGKTKAEDGGSVTLHIHGMLAETGEVFQSTHSNDQPITLPIGKEGGLPGLDAGIKLLTKGAKAVLVLPPDQAFGDEAMQGIPAGSTLELHVEIIDFKEPFKPFPMSASQLTTTESGLKYQIFEQGDGKRAEKGKNVKVHYHGTLEDGTVFDSSYQRGQPIAFPLGMGRVIQGWDEGIALLNEGGKATLVIPPDLGYGAAGAGGVIPPNATLRFDVELVEVN